MAQFNYDSLGASAIALVKKFSKPTLVQVLRSVDGDAADPSKPWRVGDPSTLTFEFQGVVVPYRQSEATPTVYQDLTVIAPGDVTSVAAKEDAAKHLGKFQDTDRILTGGDQYTVLGMKELNPGTNTIIFVLRLRSWRPTSNPPATQFSAS